MLRSIIRGERDPVVLAELARQRLRAKIPQLQGASFGKIEGHHRFLLGVLWDEVEFLEEQVERLSTRSAEVMPPPLRGSGDAVANDTGDRPPRGRRGHGRGGRGPEGVRQLRVGELAALTPVKLRSRTRIGLPPG
ncbi:MAG: hypothetical protein J0I06_01660 [Planctomycetes bacterium]|nr:hypothetical protein [Planctomycetota bacterium]